MDGMFILLVALVAITIVLRAMAEAARNSAKEEIVRRVLKEHIRQRKIDELYGRDRKSDD